MLWEVYFENVCHFQGVVKVYISFQALLSLYVKFFNEVNRKEWRWRSFIWTLCFRHFGNEDLIILTLISKQNTFPVAIYKSVEYDF